MRKYTPEQSDEFRSVAWSPDGKSIAVAGARERVPVDADAVMQPHRYNRVE